LGKQCLRFGVHRARLPLDDAFWAAARAGSLTSLTLDRVDLWQDVTFGHSLVEALTGHPTLRSLYLGGNTVAPAYHDVVGEVLADLVAANAPSLVNLDVSGCSLGDAALLPLFRALEKNTHLRVLWVLEGNSVSAEAELLLAHRFSHRVPHMVPHRAASSNLVLYGQVRLVGTRVLEQGLRVAWLACWPARQCFPVQPAARVGQARRRARGKASGGHVQRGAAGTRTVGTKGGRAPAQWGSAGARFSQAPG
jgi:hypothetical protein